jgi:hypothetical protein
LKVGLLSSNETEMVFLLDGCLDGNGKVSQGLKNPKENWDEALGQSEREKKKLVEFVGRGRQSSTADGSASGGD